jgi:hypothetical protein
LLVFARSIMMPNVLQRWFALSLICALLLSACGTLAAPTPAPLIPGLAQTLAAETLAAQFGKGSNLISQQLQTAPQGTLAAYEYQATSTPEPTSTPVPPLTLFQNSPQLGPAAQPVETCVNAAEFIGDVSIPDNTVMKKGARFVKTWKFRNSGTCTWTPDYAIVFIWGDRMAGESPKPLGRTVPPNQVVEVSIELQAPNDPGAYQGSWIFVDANGEQFGTGYRARQFFWVAIIVEGKLNGLGPGEGCVGKG